MAKMKTYAVEITVPVKRTLFVEARRPGGAIDKIYTEAGWDEAVRYADDPFLDSLAGVPPAGMTVKVREV